MCDERESFNISLLQVMKLLLKLMVVSTDTTGQTESTHTRKTTKHVMWCSLSSRGLMHQFLFAANAKGKTCFSVLQNNNVPPINNLFVEKVLLSRWHGTPPPLHSDPTSVFNDHFPGSWVGHRERAGYASQSPIDIYLCGILKHTVYP